jgi:uncharacterized protein
MQPIRPEPVLLDTGPLVAWLDANDTDHQACSTFFREHPGPFLTTWPVLTEASHLVPTQVAPRLLQWIHLGGAEVVELPPHAVANLAEKMLRYADLPMDLADASLLWLAEQRGIRAVASLDRRDFSVYRLSTGEALVNLLG